MKSLSPASVVGLFAAVLPLLSAPTLAGDTWPQFRGPTGQVIAEAKGLPLTFSEEENVTWKTAIHGKAWSSPVIWGDQVWMSTASEDGKELFAVCVDKNAGQIVHDLKLFDVKEPQYAIPFNSYGSPTPVVEEGRVYVSFGSPGTACLDTKTGQKIWERTNFVCNHFRGAGSSPVIHGDLLFMNFDGSDYQFIVGLNKNTGETVWRTERSVDYGDVDASGKIEAEGDWRKAFSTPRIASFEGQEDVLISLGSKAVYAYEPTSGNELWRAENHSTHSGSPTPVVGREQGLLYVCMGLGANQLWAIRPGGRDVINDTHVAWKVLQGVPGRASPLLVDDLLFMVDDVGTTTCLDAKTGKVVWHERLEGNYSASPLYADGRVYFFGEEGEATVIEAGREYKVLAENSLGDGFMASPAVADNALFLRSRTHLYRVEQAKAEK